MRNIVISDYESRQCTDLHEKAFNMHKAYSFFSRIPHFQKIFDLAIEENRMSKGQSEWLSFIVSESIKYTFCSLSNKINIDNSMRSYTKNFKSEDYIKLTRELSLNPEHEFFKLIACKHLYDYEEFNEETFPLFKIFTGKYKLVESEQDLDF